MTTKHDPLDTACAKCGEIIQASKYRVFTPSGKQYHAACVKVKVGK